MENWGLVTFREIRKCPEFPSLYPNKQLFNSGLLMDPAKTSIFVKSHIALVVAHELAHFWFGDLVTMV